MMPKLNPDQLDQLLMDITALEDIDSSLDANSQDDLVSTVTKQIQPLSPSPGLRDKLMNTVTSETSAPGFADRLSRFFKLDLRVVHQHLADLANITAPNWEATRLEGIWLKHFDGGPGLQQADCGFVYMEPGTSAPMHRHIGNEWMMVLQGEALIGDGQSMLAGDVLLSPAESCHEFSAVGKQALVFAVIVFEGIDWHPD